MLAAERRDVRILSASNATANLSPRSSRPSSASPRTASAATCATRRRGLCQRVYGGALPVSPHSPTTPRESVAPESKARVAAHAAGLIQPGSRVILDGGTTTLAVARALPPDLSHRHHAQPDGRRRPDRAPDGRGVRPRRPLFKHSAVTCGAAAAEAAAGISRRCVLDGSDRGPPRGGPDDRRRRRSGHEAGPGRPRRRHLRPGEHREDRRRVAVHRDAAVRDMTAILTDAPADHPVVVELRGQGSGLT